jgi:hypothetical protein
MEVTHLMLGRILLMVWVLVTQVTPETGVLWGRITDQIGNPIPGAEVSVTARADPRSLKAKTNASGEYVLSSVPTGMASVSVNCLGFVPGSTSVLILAGRNLLDTGLDVALIGDRQPYHIKGKTLTQEGKPLADVSVTLRNIYQPTLAVQARTDKDGTFSITILKRGDYVLAATMPGYVAAIVNIELESTREIVSDLSLKPLRQR